MWCEFQKAMCFIPGFTGFYPGYSHQIGKSYAHPIHQHHMKEDHHYGGRSSDCNEKFWTRVDSRPGRIEKRDLGYHDCSTCTYESGRACNHNRNVRSAGLTSEEMWKTMNPKGEFGEKTEENKARSVHKSGYSRHGTNFPSYYQHYEGYRDGRGRELCHNCDHGHFHSSDQGYHGNYSRHRQYFNRENYGHDHKHKNENPVSVSVCIMPNKPKGKFHLPCVCGDYDLEKNKICFQLPDRHRLDYHNKSHLNTDKDYINSRYYCSENRRSNQVGRKYGRSARTATKPHCAGFITGVQFCVGEPFGKSSGRMWKGNCC